LFNSGKDLPEEELDIADEIRKIPENAATAKPFALSLFKRLHEVLVPAPAGFLPQIEFDTIIKKIEAAASTDSDHCSRILADPKDLQTGRFGVAARGLHHFLKVGPQWKDSALSISGIQDEISRLADCPDCAQTHASVFETQMVRRLPSLRRAAALLQPVTQHVHLSQAQRSWRQSGIVRGGGGFTTEKICERQTESKTRAPLKTSSSIHQRGFEHVLGVRLIVASDRHRTIWACVGPVTFV
jgi:hypothetical protein